MSGVISGIGPDTGNKKGPYYPLNIRPCSCLFALNVVSKREKNAWNSIFFFSIVLLFLSSMPTPQLSPRHSKLFTFKLTKIFLLAGILHGWREDVLFSATLSALYPFTHYSLIRFRCTIFPIKSHPSIEVATFLLLTPFTLYPLISFLSTIFFR